MEFRKTIDKLQEDKLWNPNYDYGNGYNLVHAAVEYAPKDTKSDILEFLLQDGANIDALYKGKNPLSIARSNNKINLVNQILHFQSSSEETKLDNTDFDGTISNNIPSDYEIKELYFLFLAEIKNNDLTGVKKS